MTDSPLQSSSLQSSPLLTSPEVQRLLVEEKLLLIDKPAGRSSHYMVNFIRTKTGVHRVGHAGTLDPLATGLLIVLVGREATRIQDQLIGLDKEYDFSVVLGVETETYDTVGQETRRWDWDQVKKIRDTEIQDALQRFVGEYIQEVPAYSAVKQHGRKLYEMALKHQRIELPKRNVRIFSLQLLGIDRDEDEQTCVVHCHVHCGSGTYVRSLAVDIGHALGIGATVSALRRTKIGPFCVQMVQPHSLELVI